MPGRLSTNVGGLRGKVKRCARIETRLSDLAGSEETLTGCIESSVESNQKMKGTLGQNLCLSVLSNFAVDFQANSHGFSVGRMVLRSSCKTGDLYFGRLSGCFDVIITCFPARSTGLTFSLFIDLGEMVLLPGVCSPSQLQPVTSAQTEMRTYVIDKKQQCGGRVSPWAFRSDPFC
jgi:hypothetical protein